MKLIEMLKRLAKRKARYTEPDAASTDTGPESPQPALTTPPPLTGRGGY